MLAGGRSGWKTAWLRTEENGSEKMHPWIPTRERSPAWTQPRWKGVRTGAWLATLLGAACLAQNGSSPNSSNGTFRPDKVYAVSPVNQRPDANKLMEINIKRVQQQRFGAANAERKRQMAEDSARLLEFAAALKEDVAKAGEAHLPLEAVTRAGVIEQLAHAVSQKMKLTVAAP